MGFLVSISADCGMEEREHEGRFKPCDDYIGVHQVNGQNEWIRLVLKACDGWLSM